MQIRIVSPCTYTAKASASRRILLEGRLAWGRGRQGSPETNCVVHCCIRLRLTSRPLGEASMTSIKFFSKNSKTKCRRSPLQKKRSSCAAKAVPF